MKDHELIPFKDNKEVMMGEPISKILLDAIEKSRMGRTAIVIFFKFFHVVLGRICVSCMEGGIRVLPIFYPKKKIKKFCDMWILVLF